MTKILENEGYGVMRAYSGTEALYLLSQKKPDLILLDLMLPRMERFIWMTQKFGKLLKLPKKIMQAKPL